MGRNRRLSEDQCRELRRRYDRGESLAELAEDFKIAPGTVARAIELAGGSIRSVGRRVIDKDTEEQIIALYNAGFSVPKIKEQAGLSIADATIHAALRRNGIRARASGPLRMKDAYLNADGYMIVRIDENDPMISMGRRERTRWTVLQHRLVLARKIGRPLLPYETVHHKNGNRVDNRPENLELRVGPHGKGATEAHCPTCRCFDH